MRRIRHVVAIAIGASTALVAPAGVVSRASAAVSADRGTGVGTSAALNSPGCDEPTGYVLMPPPFRIPCVRQLGASGNGGATAQGVTPTTIKVIMVTPTEQDIGL